MLDFYLIGIARSGTSVSQRMLNLHPKIFCGLERFPIHLHPKSIKFPDHFLDASIKGNPVGVSQAQSILSKMTNFELNLLCAIGDKLPRKIYAPSHLDFIKTNLFIYRHYKQVCASWDARAKNNNDHGWSPYRTGIFYFFDLIVFFFFMNKERNLKCVDYKSCYYGDFKSELAIWLDGLAVSLDEYPVRQFSEQILRKSPFKNTVNVDIRYDQFSNFINLPEFEKKYSSSIDNNERLKCINQYSQYIRNNHALFMNKFIDLLTEYEHIELLNVANLIDRFFTKNEKALFLSSRINQKLQSFFSQKDKKQTKQFYGCVLDAPQLHMQLSHFFQRNGKLIDAINQVKQAIALKDDVPIWHNRLANLLMQSGDMDGAGKIPK